MLGFHPTASAQYRRDLDVEMDRLDADVALILRRSLDYMPIWSENSDTIYVNVLGKWYAMEATRASLVETTIRGAKGGWNQAELLEPVDQKTIDGFELDGYMKHVAGDTLDNIEASIDYIGFSSILTVKVDGKVFYQQQSGGEEYIFPVISPDKKYVAFITVINGLMIVKLPSEVQVTKIDKIVNKGISAMNRNDCEKAIEYFNEALEKDSTNKEALHNLVSCYYNLNQIDAMETAALRGMRLDPDCFETKALYAGILFNRKDFDGAAEICEQIVEEHPHYYKIYSYLYNIYTETENREKACYTIERAAKIGLSNEEFAGYRQRMCD